MKWLIVADLDKQIILAQRGRQAPWRDCRALPDLVDAARRVMPIGLVSDDAEFAPNKTISAFVRSPERAASSRPSGAAAKRLCGKF